MCHCTSRAYMGPLEANKSPQMVSIAIHGTITQSAFEAIAKFNETFDRIHCPVRFTIFVRGNNETDKCLLNSLYLLGHEIAIETENSQNCKDCFIRGANDAIVH
ncbi:hypothetical protein ACOME3_001186 [Neoechinorhynchus agilis]